MKHQTQKATAMLELTFLLVIIIAAVLTFQKYIVRGFAGRWKQTADTFSPLQYDPNKTVECGWSETANIWYDAKCFNEHKQDDLDSLYSACVAACSASKPTGTHQSWGGCDPNPAEINCFAYSGRIGWAQMDLYDAGCCHSQCMRRCISPAEAVTAGNCPDKSGLCDG